MRRTLVILLLVILEPIGGFSQGFHAGLRFGMCASQISGDHLSGFDKAGIVGGAFVNRDFSKKVSVQMEMIFIQKGSRKAVNVDDNSYYRLRLHYFEVPLLFQFHATKKITLEAGASFGVLIFSEENDQLGVILNTPEFEKTEFSSQIGMQYVFTENWELDLRYSASLAPVRPYEGSYNFSSFDQGQYNSSLQLTLAYSF